VLRGRSLVRLQSLPNFGPRVDVVSPGRGSSIGRRWSAADLLQIVAAEQYQPQPASPVK
jgi:hypothetical protein